MEAVNKLLHERLFGAKKLAVLGAGSVLRSDDAAGGMIIEALSRSFEGRKNSSLLLCDGETAPENYSGKIERFAPTHLLVVDAADVGANPGYVVEIDPRDVGGPSFCSHMLPLRIMLEYLQQQTGAQVMLLGIQPKSIAFDGDVSEEIRRAVEAICGAVSQIIEALPE